MVTRALNLCGVYLGEKEQIRRFGDDNVEGYWENADFVDLNERLLAALDGGWDVPFREEPGWEARPALEPLRQEARHLAEWFADREPWGWKDPRNALVLPFWKSVIPGLRFVVCVRDPLEVALSLSQRGRSSLRFGLRLWEEYYRRILAHTSVDDSLVTDYARCLEQPEQECRRLAAFAGRPFSYVAQASMNPQLRHQRASPDPGMRALVPAFMEDLYESLRHAASLDAVPPPRDRLETAGGAEFRATARLDLVDRRALVLTRCVVPVEQTPDGMIFEATSIDPQFELSVAPFSPAAVRAVRFRMRRDTNESAVAQLFWTHRPGEPFTELDSTTVFLDPTAGWSEYRFRLDRPPVRERWMSGQAIARLRFDPANVPGRFEVASLILEG